MQLKTVLNCNFDKLGSGNFFFKTKINARCTLKYTYLVLFQIPQENAEHKQLFFDKDLNYMMDECCY